MRVLPILFNTEMVRAILDGRKTVTRRVVKPSHLRVLDSPYHKEHPEVKDITLINKLCEPPCQPGDILYVWETWFYESHMHGKTQGRPDLPSGRYSHRYVYKADESDYPVGIGVGASGWRPSIHMPKEAARIWLKVMDVRVERLKEIDTRGCQREGIDITRNGVFKRFSLLWDSAIKKADLDRYGWDANPWVWVIEFERCEKPDENEPAGSPEWKDNFMQRFCKVD